MTPNLRSVEDTAGEIWRCIKKDFERKGLQLPDNWNGVGMAYGGYSRAIENLTTDRAHIATVLIAGLDTLWRYSVVTVKIEPDGTIVKSYTLARSDVEALIRQTLTDVTSEEK